MTGAPATEPHPRPVSLGSTNASPPVGRRRRRAWVVVGAAIAATLVVAAGAAIYYTIAPKPAGSPLPTIWSLGRANCPQCGPGTMLLASDASDLFVLEQGNITLYSNVSYELSAYNWSTGRAVWSSIPLVVGEGVLGYFGQSLGGHADLVVEGGVLSMVTFGTWVQAAGQPLVPATSTSWPVTWVLEWNATTGAFLSAQHWGAELAWPFPSIFVGQDDGWLSVGVSDLANFTVSTLPIAGRSSVYGEWNATVDTARAGPALFETAGLVMSGGLVSVVLMGNADLVAVLNGESGNLTWEGQLPDAYTVPGNATFSLLPTIVGEFSNVVQIGTTFYYVANRTGGTALQSFDIDTGASASVANLTGLVDPLDAELSLPANGTLVVTDGAGEHYWAFSTTGTSLWNRSLRLDQVATTGVSGVEGVDDCPLPLGDGYALIASQWSSDFSSYPGDNYPVATVTIPVAVVDGETGATIWSSTYTQSMTLGPAQNYPVTYWPLIAQGPFAAFAYYPGEGLGWDLLVSDFSAVPG